MDLRSNARYRMHWDYYPDEDDPDDPLSLGPIPRVADVTEEVRRLINREKTQAATIKALQEELRDIKTRRSWEDLSMVTDERTGMTAVVRTYYRWQAETMRLDVSPEMMRDLRAW